MMKFPAIPGLAIFLYFPLLFLGIELSKQTGFYSIRILPFLPFLLYIIIYVSSLFHPKILKPTSLFLAVIMLTYLLLHVRVAYLLGDTKMYVLQNFLTLFIHALFWFILSLHIKNRQNLNEVLKYLFGGLFFCFVFIVFIPMNYIGKFRIGGHYNLGDINTPAYVPFFNSTLEPPLISSIACIISFSVIAYVFHVKRLKVKNRFSLGTLVGCMVIFGLSLLEIILINRRGPMIITFFSLFLVIFSRISYRSNFRYIIPLLALIPVFWQAIIEQILPLFENELARSLIARTDAESIRSATGRILQWGIAVTYIMKFSFSLDYILGVGNLTELQVLGPYGHAHNSFFQLFIQVGVLGTLLNVFLIITCLRLFRRINRKGFLSLRVLVMLSIFVLVLLLSATESLFMGTFFSHLLFLTLIILIIRTGRLADEPGNERLPVN